MTLNKEYEEGYFAKYCTIDEVKDRLLININDTTYDTSLTNAIEEASRVVDMFIRAYTTVPISQNECIEVFTGCWTVYYYPFEIQAATADLAASIFKRRMLPGEVNLRGALQPDQINQIDATGWFALGIRKLEQYIKSKYVIQDKPLPTTETFRAIYNPEVFRELFERGLITGAEFRQYISDSTNESKIIDIHEKYEFRRQKQFKIVSGVEDEDTYEIVD